MTFVRYTQDHLSTPSISRSIFHSISHLMLLMIVGGFSLLLNSCGPPKKDEAVIAYEQLMQAIRMGNSEQVWSHLSVNTQKLFTQKIRAQNILKAAHSSDSPSSPSSLDSQNSHAPSSAPHTPKEKSINSITRGGENLNVDEVKNILLIQLDWSFESPFGQKVHLKSTGKMIRVIEAFYSKKQWEIPVLNEENRWRVDLSSARQSP